MGNSLERQDAIGCVECVVLANLSPSRSLDQFYVGVRAIQIDYRLPTPPVKSQCGR